MGNVTSPGLRSVGGVLPNLGLWVMMGKTGPATRSPIEVDVFGRAPPCRGFLQ